MLGDPCQFRAGREAAGAHTIMSSWPWFAMTCAACNHRELLTVEVWRGSMPQNRGHTILTRSRGFGEQGGHSNHCQWISRGAQ